MKTSVNANNIESKNVVYNAIITAIKGDKMIGRHIAQTYGTNGPRPVYGTNGPRPVYGIEVWESIVHVHTDTDRRIFDKAIDRLLKAHKDLFKWADFQKASEEGPHIVLALTDETVRAKNEAEKERKAQERQERYNARCKELEAEALAQMPYKVGDTVKSRYGEIGRVIEMHPEITGDIDSPHLIYEYDGKPTVNVVILDADGKRHCAHWSFFTLQEASEIKVGTEVWTTIELNEEYGKRGKVVRKFFADHGVWCLDIEFEDGTTACYAEEYVTTEKPWAVVGAKCRHKYLNRDVVLTITAVGQYYGIKAESEDGKVKRCGLVRDFEPVEDVKEAEGIKVGDKVRHNKHEEVATVTAIREAFVNGCDGYRYLYTLDFGQSVLGPFQVELNGGEFLREAFTLYEPSEIKPKAAFQIGDRVERKSDGERGTVDGYDVTDGKLTYIVKYDRTQRRQSDGFEYLSEELNGDELQTDGIESRKRTIIARAKEGKQAWHYYKGCEVRVRKAYTNDSKEPENWTYCVSWYADGQLVECENGVRLEQAAKALNDLPQWAEARKAA